MAGLTTLGTIHTAVSLIAVAAGIVAIVRHKAVTSTDGAGKTYIVFTLLTALTALASSSTAASDRRTRWR